MTIDDDFERMKRKVVKDWEIAWVYFYVFSVLCVEASGLVPVLMKRSVVCSLD